MLNASKLSKLNKALKKYYNKYLDGEAALLDETNTRLMINSLLCEVLGYAPIKEVKTEHTIKNMAADYLVQVNGMKLFLLEVALSADLNAAHLRKAVIYGANESIEWALLTNGKCLELYKILFSKPIETRKVFCIDLSDPAQLKKGAEVIQFLHKDAVTNKGLNLLWNKSIALDPANVAGLLYTENVIRLIKKSLKTKYGHDFPDEEIKASIDRIVFEAIRVDQLKHLKVKKSLKPALPLPEPSASWFFQNYDPREYVQ